MSRPSGNHHAPARKKGKSKPKATSWETCKEDATQGAICIEKLLKLFPGVRTKIIGHPTTFTQDLTKVFARVSAAIVDEDGQHIEAVIDHNSDVYRLSDPIPLKDPNRPIRRRVLSLASSTDSEPHSRSSSSTLDSDEDTEFTTQDFNKLFSRKSPPSQRQNRDSSDSDNDGGGDYDGNHSDSDTELTEEDFERLFGPRQSKMLNKDDFTDKPARRDNNRRRRPEPDRQLVKHIAESSRQLPQLPIVVSLTEQDDEDLRATVKRAPILDTDSEQVFREDLKQFDDNRENYESDPELDLFIDEWNQIYGPDGTSHKSAAIYSRGEFNRVDNIRKGELFRR